MTGSSSCVTLKRWGGRGEKNSTNTLVCKSGEIISRLRKKCMVTHTSSGVVHYYNEVLKKIYSQVYACTTPKRKTRPISSNVCNKERISVHPRLKINVSFFLFVCVKQPPHPSAGQHPCYFIATFLFLFFYCVITQSTLPNPSTEDRTSPADAGSGGSC